MNLLEAVDLLDEYSNNAEEFDPGQMLLGIQQIDLTKQVITSRIADAHLQTAAVSLEHLVVDALVHGICIGALMVKDGLDA